MLFLFDIDGTLIATGGVGRRALERAMAELHDVAEGLRGIALDGMTDPLIVEQMFSARLARSPHDHEVAALLDRYLAHLEDEVRGSPRHYRVLPGVTGALDFLETRPVAVGLATGNVERGAAIKLAPGDLWRRFRFGGYGSDAADRGELVAHAITRGEAHAGRAFARERVFVIGDTPRDVAAAHACGALAVGVATGSYGVDALRACGADVVFETLEELPGWAERLG